MQGQEDLDRGPLGHEAAGRIGSPLECPGAVAHVVARFHAGESRTATRRTPAEDATAASSTGGA